MRFQSILTVLILLKGVSGALEYFNEFWPDLDQQEGYCEILRQSVPIAMVYEEMQDTWCKPQSFAASLDRLASLLIAESCIEIHLEFLARAKESGHKPMEIGVEMHRNQRRSFVHANLGEIFSVLRIEQLPHKIGHFLRHPESGTEIDAMEDRRCNRYPGSRRNSLASIKDSIIV
jgi:hypothetical protein